LDRDRAAESEEIKPGSPGESNRAQIGRRAPPHLPPCRQLPGVATDPPLELPLCLPGTPMSPASAWRELVGACPASSAIFAGRRGPPPPAPTAAAAGEGRSPPLFPGFGGPLDRLAWAAREDGENLLLKDQVQKHTSNKR
jgi:hypothetical protein